jgi:hypothetical protein
MLDKTTKANISKSDSKDIQGNKVDPTHDNSVRVFKTSPDTVALQVRHYNGKRTLLTASLDQDQITAVINALSTGRDMLGKVTI